MSKRIDLTGQRFGKLVVIKMIYNGTKSGTTLCECKCDCGNIIIKSSPSLRKAKLLPSCGCNNINDMRNRFAKNIEGKKFGRLTVLETIWSSEARKSKVRCLCDCGNEVVKLRHYIMDGSVKSCGCLLSDVASTNHSKDYSNYISDFGIKIIKKSSKNKYNQQLWECICGRCGKHFVELPIKIKRNCVRSCGCLSSSSSELFISKILDDNNIQYRQQYTYNDCVNLKGNKLRFDFAIIKNNKVFCLIEYDGQQHYKSVPYFGGDSAFKTRQEYDNIKNQYCTQNNIPLFRLPFYLSQDEIRNKILSIVKP